MADPFVSDAPEAAKDPPDGWTRKGLPAHRAFIPRGLFIPGGVNVRLSMCLQLADPPSFRLLPAELDKCTLTRLGNDIICRYFAARCGDLCIPWK